MSTRITEAARDLITKAMRVESKYGISTDGKPRDWTEWQNLRDSIIALEAALSTEPGEAEGKPYRIEHDGFEGTVQGHYVTREGKRGVVLQQLGTKVVHVYGEKWLAVPMPEDTHHG